jgi:acyl-CoA synthetase (AMP-forming)/AMP-acid ligase II
MSFFALPTMVKRLADDRAIAEADLSHLKTIIYGGAPMYLAAVVGRTDAKWGEAVVAFAVAADRVAQPSVKDLDQTCLDNIARFKRPKDYRFVDALPTNNYGKVVKRELRDRLRAETADGGSR